MLADVVHEGGVNPRHERGDGFPGVVGRPIASPTNLELQASGCRGVRTLGEDLLDGIVVLLSVVVVRISLMCGVVQGHMLDTEIGFPHTELTFVALPKLSVAHLDAVGVLTNPANHLPGCEPGFGAVGAHGAGSDHPHRVSHPELLRCRARGGLLTHGMLLLELLADVPRRCLLPRKEFLGIHRASVLHALAQLHFGLARFFFDEATTVLQQYETVSVPKYTEYTIALPLSNIGVLVDVDELWSFTQSISIHILFGWFPGPRSLKARAQYKSNNHLTGGSARLFVQH